MKIDNCQNCKFIGVPISMTGVKDNAFQWEESTIEEEFSCCHPKFNGGVQLTSL